MKRITHGYATFRLRRVRGRHGMAEVYIGSYVQNNQDHILAPPLVWVTKQANDVWLKRLQR